MKDFNSFKSIEISEELLGENLSSLKGKTHQKPLVLSFFSTFKDPSRKSWNGHKGISMGGFEEGGVSH